jgi:hypothetical protein
MQGAAAEGSQVDLPAPPSFLCPVTGDLMHDPVTCADGHSYERYAITRWLSENRTSPITGADLATRHLIPNHALRNAIEDWEDACARRRLSAPLPVPSPCAARAAPVATTNSPECTAVVGVSAGECSAGSGGGDAAASGGSSGSNDSPPLWSGQAIMYRRADGVRVSGTVLAAHPGAPDDPEPYYTVVLEDGSERETIRSRLRPVDPIPGHTAVAPLAPPADVEEDDLSKTASEAHPMVPPPRPPLSSAEVAAHVAEEAARRQAVERSRLEARQARAERRKHAEAAAEALHKQQEGEEYRRRQQQTAPPPSGWARGGGGWPFERGSGWPRSGPMGGGRPPSRATAGARRPAGPMPTRAEDPLQAAGEAFSAAGEAISGAFDTMGGLAQQLIGSLATGAAAATRPPPHVPRPPSTS